MSRDELVLKLSAAMLITFEFIEVIEDVAPLAAHYFNESMHHLGNLIEIIAVEEMKETGRVIGRPVIEREVAFNEDTFYEDLNRLEKALKKIEDSFEDPNSYWVRRAREALNEGVQSVLVSERQRLAQDMERVNPWSVLDAID